MNLSLFSGVWALLKLERVVIPLKSDATKVSVYSLKNIQ